MEHVRTSALKAVVRILEGIPGVKAVRASRRFPYDGVALPAIDCSWVQEQGDPAKAGRPGQRMMDRDMVLRVRVVATGDDEPDAPIEFTLDAIQLAIERRLAANQLLRTDEGVPTVRRVKFLRTVSEDNSKNAATYVATAVFFQVTASHREGAPDTTLPQN